MQHKQSGQTVVDFLEFVTKYLNRTGMWGSFLLRIFPFLPLEFVMLLFGPTQEQGLHKSTCTDIPVEEI